MQYLNNYGRHQCTLQRYLLNTPANIYTLFHSKRPAGEWWLPVAAVLLMVVLFLMLCAILLQDICLSCGAISLMSMVPCALWWYFYWERIIKVSIVMLKASSTYFEPVAMSFISHQPRTLSWGSSGGYDCSKRVHICRLIDCNSFQPPTPSCSSRGKDGDFCFSQWEVLFKPWRSCYAFKAFY